MSDTTLERRQDEPSEWIDTVPPLDDVQAASLRRMFNLAGQFRALRFQLASMAYSVMQAYLQTGMCQQV